MPRPCRNRRAGRPARACQSCRRGHCSGGQSWLQKRNKRGAVPARCRSKRPNARSPKGESRAGRLDRVGKWLYSRRSLRNSQGVAGDPIRAQNRAGEKTGPLVWLILPGRDSPRATRHDRPPDQVGAGFLLCVKTVNGWAVRSTEPVPSGVIDPRAKLSGRVGNRFGIGWSPSGCPLRPQAIRCLVHSFSTKLRIYRRNHGTNGDVSGV